MAQPLDFSGTNPTGTPTALDAYSAGNAAISFREQLPDLASKLREALTTKFNESPLFKQRETAMQNFLSAPSAINADLASMQKAGTILSPTQQQEISGARRAAAFAPLSNTNLMLSSLSGGMENMVSGGVKAFEAASQGMTDRANLMNKVQEQEFERQMKEKQFALEVQKANKTGGSDILTQLKWLAAAKKPTAGQQKLADDSTSALGSLEAIKNALLKDKNVLAKTQAWGGLGMLFDSKARAVSKDIMNVRDIITRIRTGAALNQDEEVFYNNFVANPTESVLGFNEGPNRAIEILEGIFNKAIQRTENPYMNMLENMMMGQLGDTEGFIPD